MMLRLCIAPRHWIISAYQKVNVLQGIPKYKNDSFVKHQVVE